MMSEAINDSINTNILFTMSSCERTYEISLKRTVQSFYLKLKFDQLLYLLIFNVYNGYIQPYLITEIMFLKLL